jgi:hypothetical protein
VQEGGGVNAQPEFALDGTIIAFWKAGLDTYRIAELAHVHQSVVANRLARLRDAGAA